MTAVPRLQAALVELRSCTLSRTVDVVAADWDDAHEAVRP